MPSRKGRTKFLTAEKSVFTKRGPHTGVREVAASVPSFPSGAAHESARIEPVCQSVDLRVQGNPFAALFPPLFGSPTWLGRLKPVRRSRRRARRSGCCYRPRTAGILRVTFSITFTDQSPRIALVAPFQSAAELLAFSKRQIVEHASGELTVGVDLGQSPSPPFGTRQRPVDRPGECPQAIWQAGVEGARPGVSHQCIEAVS